MATDLPKIWLRSNQIFQSQPSSDPSMVSRLVPHIHELAEAHDLQPDCISPSHHSKAEATRATNFSGVMYQSFGQPWLYL